MHAYDSMKNLKRNIIMVALAAVLTACHNVMVPSSFTDAGKAPTIYPDYSDVTVPVNTMSEAVTAS